MLQDAPIYAYIPVTDLARARRFYEEKVGLTPAEVRPGGVTYRFGGGTGAFMYVSQGAGTSRASTAFWQVKDIAAEVAALEKRGVSFERYDLPGLEWRGAIARAGDVLNAWFKDSEGNILALIQAPA